MFWNYLAHQNGFLMLGISEQNWFSIGQEQAFVLIGLVGDLVVT